MDEAVAYGRQPHQGMISSVHRIYAHLRKALWVDKTADIKAEDARDGIGIVRTE